ncbi:MAG: hypothetical protein OSB69_14150, partial [Alphaproteobacteria bacterium]|nr:hypothetical protein [Alphaproteobacteria bacterium]
MALGVIPFGVAQFGDPVEGREILFLGLDSADTKGPGGTKKRGGRVHGFIPGLEDLEIFAVFPVRDL